MKKRKKEGKNYAAVSAAKVTLEAITRSIAYEFAKYGIRANCLQPSIFRLGLFQ